jgi:transposase
MNQPTRPEESIENRGVLYLALELGSKEWKLALASQIGEKPRLRTIVAGNLKSLQEEIVRARQRFGVSGDQVASCYEAGREGFWLHRALVDLGIDNVVVDSSSIEVNRRGRRAKTDRLDAEKLLSLRIRSLHGEPKVWSVVRVPTPKQEDARQLSRELEELKHERTSHRNRIQSLLVSQGLRVKLGPQFLLQLEQTVLWDGNALAPHLKERIQREYERLTKVQEQIQDLEKHRKQAVAERTTERDLELIQRLSLLKGIGLTSAWVFVQEFFGWRQFRNRREVGALAGLVPVPYQSGERLDREQGISKAGNRRVRSLAVEIAWSWLRWQPQSRLSLWFRERYGPGSRRSRRVGIVALARKLLVEMWRYLQTGVVPDGAILKTV